MYVVLLLFLSIQKLVKRSAEATITACFIYRTFHRLTG